MNRLGKIQQKLLYYDYIMNYRRLFIPNSIVFITIVTFNREEFLIPNIELLKNSIKQTKEKYQFNIVAICVLKNHIHMLLKTNNIKDYPDIIKNIKRNFSVKFDISQIPDYNESDSSYCWVSPNLRASFKNFVSWTYLPNNTKSWLSEVG